MITEDYVSFEIAKLLKEKGFNGPCSALYDRFHEDYPQNGFESQNFNKGTIRKDVISAPTLQMAMKWLREEHKIDICTCRELDEYGDCFDGYISVIYKDGIYKITIRDVESDLNYEQVCEEAIKYCLEHLI